MHWIAQPHSCLEVGTAAVFSSSCASRPRRLLYRLPSPTRVSWLGSFLSCLGFCSSGRSIRQPNLPSNHVGQGAGGACGEVVVDRSKTHAKQSSRSTNERLRYPTRCSHLLRSTLPTNQPIHQPKSLKSILEPVKIADISRLTNENRWNESRCGRGMQWKKALSSLVEMREAGIKANSFVYSAAIDACAKVRERETTVVLVLVLAGSFRFVRRVVKAKLASVVDCPC